MKMSTLVFCCVALPFIMALVLYFTQSSSTRKLIVPAAITIMAVAAVTLGANGAFRLEVGSILGLSADTVFSVLDLLLLVYILGIGWKLGSRLIMGMTLLGASGYVIINLIVDLLQAWIDPRVSLD